MKKTSRRPNNKIARLPRATRFRIYDLYLNGETYDGIRKALDLQGVHNTSFIATWKTREFLAYQAEYSALVADTMADAMRANVLRQNDIDASAIPEAELLKQINEMLPLIEDAKSVKTLTGALKDLEAIRTNRRIQALEKQLEELKIAHALELSKKDADIVRLREEIATLKIGKKPDSASVQEHLDNILGLNKKR